MVFVDSEGNEVDRIIGFLPPTEYLMRIENIIGKRNTLDDYIARYERGDVTEDIIAGIAMKYEDRSENDKAAEFYSLLIKHYTDSSSDYIMHGKFFLSKYKFENGKENALKNYVSKNPGSKFIHEAYETMVYHYANAGQLDKELKIYEEMLLLFSDDPNALNMYAWRMAEIETNLEDALLKARKAVYLSVNEPIQQARIIDTEAEVLWKMGRYDDAINAIDKAISIDPEDQYYKAQKEKFIQSKKETIQSA